MISCVISDLVSYALCVLNTNKVEAALPTPLNACMGVSVCVCVVVRGCKAWVNAIPELPEVSSVLLVDLRYPAEEDAETPASAV